jgi:DNA polymerase elongation subunit (family B)
MKLTNHQIKEIYSLSNKGYSHRRIAEIVLDRRSRKSTVSDLLKKGVNPTLEEPIKKPIIVYLDIETAPCLGYYWKRWEENISEAQVVSESFIICYSYKLAGDEEIYFNVLNPTEIDTEDDSRLLKGLHKILSNSDIIIAHNGIRFDLPVIQTRMLFHGLTPPLPYKVIDTLRMAKRNFKFPSNSLSSLATYLKLTRKTSPNGGFNLWKGFLKGEEEAIQTMIDYNVNDVVVLEELYLTLRPWDKSHPNLAIYDNSDIKICPVCSSKNISQTDKFNYTNISAFVVHKCDDCGKNFRDRKSINNKNKLFTGL